MGSSLRLRVLTLVVLGFAGVALPTALAFTWLVGAAMVQLGVPRPPLVEPQQAWQPTASDIGWTLFVPFGILLAVAMVLVTGAMVFVFKSQVLDRLRQLEHVVGAARVGDYGPALAMGFHRQDDIGRLSGALTEMAVAVSESTRLLEARVSERTDALERLALGEKLMGLGSRAGFVKAFASATGTGRHGLLLVDIDGFKRVNDEHGHAAGDAVLLALADRIEAVIGPRSLFARWGGDEFIILIEENASHLLRATAARLVDAAEAEMMPLPDGSLASISTSIGACLVEPGDTIETALDMVQAALYLAQEQGSAQAVVLDGEEPAARRASAG